MMYPRNGEIWKSLLPVEVKERGYQTMYIKSRIHNLNQTLHKAESA